MNFENHEKKIQRLCLLPDRRASKGKTVKKVAQYHKGVYLISRDVDDVCYKIGVAYGAGGLFQRLKQYKHCFPYPTEYYLQYLFLSATGWRFCLYWLVYLEVGIAAVSFSRVSQSSFLIFEVSI